MHDTLSVLYRIKQGETESNDCYLGRFKVNVMAAELTHGGHVFSPKFKGRKKQSNTPLKNEDSKRYGALASDLKEVYYLSRDECPTTMANMYQLMINYNRKLDANKNIPILNSYL